MNINKAIWRCPICSGQMRITALSCGSCGTELRGNFESCAVCRLPPEAYALLLAFIKTRGSIKEMEKELGVSYPTVRSRLDELQRLMGFAASGSSVTAKEVIAMLERGEITPEEAEGMLKGA